VINVIYLLGGEARNAAAAHSGPRHARRFAASLFGFHFSHNFSSLLEWERFYFVLSLNWGGQTKVCPALYLSHQFFVFDIEIEIEIVIGAARRERDFTL